MTLLAVLSQIVTAVFFGIILSYYALLFIKKKILKKGARFKSISIIMPAHNEEQHIAEAIRAVIGAKFQGKKQILVVDDGSIDRTRKIASQYPVTLIRTSHLGKSNAINTALKKATGELIAIVDADSIIAPDALVEAAKLLADKNTAAVSAMVTVRNRKQFLGMWMHIEQLYNSLMRTLFSKINANIATTGPLTVYRKDRLLQIGGFETKGFSEDIDVALRLLRKGYAVECAEKSISDTYMPVDVKGFLHQRSRFVRGWVNILKRHFQFRFTIVDAYSLPLAIFWYVQSVIMSSFIIYQVISGYQQYFLSQGVVFSVSALIFFLRWFSIFGTIGWALSIIQGAIPLSAITIVGLLASILTYPLYIIAIIKIEKRFGWWHIVPLLFMFPYWFVIMIMYVIHLPEWFRAKQYNRWKKNE